MVTNKTYFLKWIPISAHYRDYNELQSNQKYASSDTMRTELLRYHVDQLIHLHAFVFDFAGKKRS